MSTDPKDAATAFGLHLEKAVKHAFNEQGLSFWDLIYIVQGLLGRLLELEANRDIDARRRVQLEAEVMDDLEGDDEEPLEMDRPVDRCEGNFTTDPQPYDPDDSEGEEWKRPR